MINWNDIMLVVPRPINTCIGTNGTNRRKLGDEAKEAGDED
jgi:hypothetical protein